MIRSTHQNQLGKHVGCLLIRSTHQNQLGKHVGCLLIRSTHQNQLSKLVKCLMIRSTLQMIPSTFSLGYNTFSLPYTLIARFWWDLLSLIVTNIWGQFVTAPFYSREWATEKSLDGSTIIYIRHPSHTHKSLSKVLMNLILNSGYFEWQLSGAIFKSNTFFEYSLKLNWRKRFCESGGVHIDTDMKQLTRIVLIDQ